MWIGNQHFLKRHTPCLLPSLCGKGPKIHGDHQFTFMQLSETRGIPRETNYSGLYHFESGKCEAVVFGYVYVIVHTGTAFIFVMYQGTNFCKACHFWRMHVAYHVLFVSANGRWFQIAVIWTWLLLRVPSPSSLQLQKCLILVSPSHVHSFYHFKHTKGFKHLESVKSKDQRHYPSHRLSRDIHSPIHIQCLRLHHWTTKTWKPPYIAQLQCTFERHKNSSRTWLRNWSIDDPFLTSP